jgi:hypothetical protein
MVKYGWAGVGVGLIDTLGQSVGLLKDNTVANTMKSVFGDGGFGDFYANNRRGLRGAGEIAGLAIPGTIALKGLKAARWARETGKLGSFLKNTTALDYLLGSSAQLTALETKVGDAALKGAGSFGVFSGRTFALPEVIKAKRAYYGARLVDSVRQSALFETAAFATYNQSEMLYPRDFTLSDQVKWGAAGMIGGAGIDFAMGRYAVRKLLQAQAARVTTGAAADVFALSPQQKGISTVIFRPGDRGPGLTTYAKMKNDLQGIVDAGADPALASNLHQDRTLIDATLTKNLRSMSRDKHAILTDRAELDDDQLKLGVRALTKDPTSFLFATKATQLPADQNEFYTGIQELHEAATNELSAKVLGAAALKQAGKKDESLKLLNEATEIYNAAVKPAQEIHYVIENDGRYTVYSQRAPNWLDNNSFKSIQRKAYKATIKGPLTAAGNQPTADRSKLVVSNIDTPFELHDNFRFEIHRPQLEAEKEIDVLTKAVTEPAVVPKPPVLNQEGYSALYAAASKLIRDWRPAEGQRFPLNEQMPWRQIEMTLALADKHPQAAGLIDYSGQFHNAKDAMFHVASEKYKEFLTLMDMVEAPSMGTVSFKLMNRAKITPAQVFQRLNMPEPFDLTPHPLTQVFAAAKLEKKTDLHSMFRNQNSFMPQQDHPLDLLGQAMKDAWDGEKAPEGLRTVGPLLSQGDTKPIFVAATSTPSLSFMDAKVAGMVEARRDLQLARLNEISPKSAPMVALVAQKIAGQAAGDVARQVQSLHEGVASGRGIVTGQDRLGDQIATIKAMQLIAQDTDRLIDSHVTAMSDPKLTPMVGAIFKTGNRDKLFDFNRIEQAYRHGWDIKAVETAPNGGKRFLLNKDSPINERLKGLHFSHVEIDEGAGVYMPDMSVAGVRNGYLPLTVSPEAADLAQEISRISRQSGIENNALRVALGQSPITIRDFHLPTPDLFKDDTYFIRNALGDVVATYSGPSAYENKARAFKDAGLLTESRGEPHIAVPVTDVRLEHSIFDGNFFNVINYSDQLAKTGAGITGGLAQATIDTGPETLKRMIKSLHQQFLNVGIRTRAAMFEPELNYAKNVVLSNARNELGDASIFDRYVATVFSRSHIPTGSAFGQLYGTVEKYGDRALSWLYGHYSALNAADETGVKTGKGLMALVGQQSTEEEMRHFKANLSDWSPFQKTSDWLESTYRLKMPPSARSVLAKLSLVSSTMSLRFLDVGTAVNNFLGLATTMPAIIMSMRRLPGESEEEWYHRTAAWGSQWANGTMTFSPMKAMANVAKGYWRGDYTEAMQEAARLGYFEPEYAALAKVLTEPAKGGKSDIGRWVDYASKAADKSESMSRQIAWTIGYGIGKDLHKFQDKRSLYMFAQNFVNEAIGNYSPRNKPGMFQGAVGLPLGAFQTWMFNFYRRMYGYVEHGDMRSLAAQYAAQASLFGAQSVPGFNLWNKYMFASEGTGDDSYSRIERNFPPGVRELLLHGALSGIPAMMGVDSPAYYTRGSVDFTDLPPTIMDASRAPPIQFLKQTYDGVRATMDNIFGAGGFSTQQQEEILANFSTNRAIKSITELLAGAKTDKRGDLVKTATLDFVHMASYLTGAQPSSTRHMQEAYIRQQQVELTQSDLRAKLNAKTRALIRGNEFDTSDFQDIVQAYLKSGGNSAYIGQWLRNTEMTATTPKAITKLGELGRSEHWLEFMNMLATIQQHQ